MIRMLKCVFPDAEDTPYALSFCTHMLRHLFIHTEQDVVHFYFIYYHFIEALNSFSIALLIWVRNPLFRPTSMSLAKINDTSLTLEDVLIIIITVQNKSCSITVQRYE